MSFPIETFLNLHDISVFNYYIIHYHRCFKVLFIHLKNGVIGQDRDGKEKLIHRWEKIFNPRATAGCRALGMDQARSQGLPPYLPHASAVAIPATSAGSWISGRTTKTTTKTRTGPLIWEAYITSSSLIYFITIIAPIPVLYSTEIWTNCHGIKVLTVLQEKVG